METYKVNFWNSVILIILGFWGHYASDSESITSLIAPMVGLLFFFATPALKKENPKAIHLIVLMTLFLFIPLFRQTDGNALLRVGIMLISGIMASIFYYISYLEARKLRKSES